MANMHDTYEFLKLLAVNNNREWFNANKAEYQELRKAWENDISRLLSLMGEYDESVRGLQVKDCAYRIYRDVRFSADKSPYKTYFSAVLGKKGRKCHRQHFNNYFRFFEESAKNCTSCYNLGGGKRCVCC